MTAAEFARIPLADPRADMAVLRDRIVSAVTNVIDSGCYILGPQVEDLEAELAKRLGISTTTCVGSGTDALMIGLLAVGVSAGDEVITVSHTAGPTAAAIRAIGAVPVFVDVCEDTYCMDPATIEAAVSSHTRAIVAVHLYGQPADIFAISAAARRLGVPLIEDCAQAQEALINGSPVGTIGNASCFSFYPTKVLGALGDGGMVASTDPKLSKIIRQLRAYGWSKPQYSEIAGGRCSRLDEMQAAVLRIKLDSLSEDIARRRALAQRYRAGLQGLPIALPIERLDCRHVYHLYVVRADQRDLLAAHLERAGIATGIHYQYPVHAQPGLMIGSRVSGSLKITERIVGEILSLPMYASLSFESQDRVIDSTREFFKG